MVNHNDLTANHVIHTGVYADRVAREAATGLTVADVDKVYLQRDDGTYWRLKAVSPTIVWERLGADVSSQTTQDVTVYLDPAGDDSADGSQSAPFATFSRAIREFEGKKIRHTMRIKPAAGNYTDFPTDWNMNNENASGRFIIDASGEDYPVLSGPHTIQAVTNETPVGPWAKALATRITVSGSPGWAVDAYHHKFARFTTGNWTGYCLQLHSNGTDYFITSTDWKGFQAGDAFDIVDCPVTITVSHPVRIRGSGRKNTTVTISYSNKPDLAIAGVRFVLGPPSKNPMILEGLSTSLSFVTVQDQWDTDSNSIPLTAIDCSLNATEPDPDTFDVTQLTDSFIMPLNVVSMAGVPPTAWGIDVELYSSDCNYVSCRRQVSVRETRFGFLQMLMCGGIWQHFAGGCQVAQTYIKQIGWGFSGILNFFGEMQIVSAFVDGVDEAFEGRAGSYTLLDWLQGANLTAPYAAIVKRASRITVKNASGVTVLGTVGAITFPFPAPGTNYAAWPASGTSINDGADCSVTTE